MTDVTIYCDGAAEPSNPGHGTWGAILIYGTHLKEANGYIGEHVSNNAAEITAAIEALRLLKRRCNVTIISDSQYLVRTMTDGWQRNANGELWMTLDDLCNQHDISWKWVRGHNGDVHNERAHELAIAALPKGIRPNERRR